MITDYNSFVFYESWFKMLEKIPNETERNELLNAIICFAFTGIEPVLDGVFSSMAWEGIKPLIQANKTKKAIGKLGGRPKKITTEETSGFENKKPEVFENKNQRFSEKKTSGFENKKPEVFENKNQRFSEKKTSGFENEKTYSKTNVNDNVNVNVNDNVNENKESDRDLFNIDSISTPTIDQVINYGKMPEVNLSEEECRKCFNYYDARDWMDNTGRSLKWRPLVRNWSARKHEFVASAPLSKDKEPISLEDFREAYRKVYEYDFDADFCEDMPHHKAVLNADLDTLKTKYKGDYDLILADWNKDFSKLKKAVRENKRL